MKLAGFIRRLWSWVGRRRRIILMVLTLIVLLQVAGQLIYPYEWTLPSAQLQGKPAGGRDRAEIVQQIHNNFQDAKVVLQVDQDSQTVKLSRLGATVNAGAMATELTSYSLTDRLLPFSIFLQQPEVASFEVDFNNQQLSRELEPIVKKLSTQPVDAALAIKEGELVVTNAQEGRQVNVAELKSEIIATNYRDKQTDINVPVDISQPEISDASIDSVRTEAEAVLARPISLVVVDTNQVFSPTSSQIARFLKIEGDGSGQSLKLDVNKQAVSDYVQTVWNQSKVDAQVTKVKLVDGEVASRNDGKPGLGIKRQQMTSELSERLLDGQPLPVTLYYQRQPIASPLSYQREYTSSQKGLSAYVKDVTADGSVKLTVTQLGGPGWKAAGGATDSIPSASTYKLFLMLKVFDEIERGNLSWSTKMLDTNVSNCFERTIVVSSNECSQEWLRMFGRDKVNQFLRLKGFSAGTVFPDYGATRTTAADLNKFLVQLENASVVSGQHRTMLLEKMHRQIYRRGIPAGSSARVYDKVGYLWDYVHDAAIVRHPKGTYVIVVMTKGASYERIADITRQVERILYK